MPNDAEAPSAVDARSAEVAGLGAVDPSGAVGLLAVDGASADQAAAVLLAEAVDEDPSERREAPSVVGTAAPPPGAEDRLQEAQADAERARSADPAASDRTVM